MLGRQMAIPEPIQESFKFFVQRSVDAAARR